MRVLSEHEVRELLDMASCIEAMEEVLASLARGELFNPLRSVARPEGADTLLGLMPSHRGGADACTRSRRSSSSRANPSRGLDTHMGGVLLHDGETGELLAIMNASPITEIRTRRCRRSRPARSRDRRRVASRSSGQERRRAATSTRCAPSSTTRRSASGRASSRRPRSSPARSAPPSRPRSTPRSSAPRSCARRPPRASR